MLWNANLNIKNLLLFWATEESIESTLHFKDFMLNDCLFRYNNLFKVGNVFADKEFSLMICQWLASPKTRILFSQKIEYILLETDLLDETEQEDLSTVYEIIDTYPWDKMCD